MAFRIQSSPDDEEQNSESSESARDGFSVSAEPVVDARAGNENATERPSDELPRSYGGGVLTLMARDPHRLFAYWDIDWVTVFRDQRPRDRKVHLRVTTADGAEEASLEVEPMAGTSYIDVGAGDVTYIGEIGYYEPSTVWNSVATSLPVTTPPDSLTENAEVDFATVPFHLSFQRIIDLFGVAKHDNESLTDMLARVREGAASRNEKRPFTMEQQEVVRALDEALASAPAPATRDQLLTDAGVQQHLESILGIGRSGTSPTHGFGGSSHSFRS